MAKGCVVCGRQAEHIHHRKMRSQGGGDENGNLIAVCHVCHDWIHANPEAAYVAGLLVRSWEDPADVSVRLRMPLGDAANGQEATGELREGQECPTCHRRIPKRKTQRSPETKNVTIPVPVADADTFLEMLDAAARHKGLLEKSHWRYWTVLAGLVELLQEPAGELGGE